MQKYTTQIDKTSLPELYFYLRKLFKIILISTCCTINQAIIAKNKRYIEKKDMKKIILMLQLLVCTMMYSQDSRLDIRDPYRALSQACYNRIDSSIVYDPSYRVIPYPNGDVPDSVGVCTDAVIRVLRDIGFDLQSYVQCYRERCGLKIDTNIDHRRVRNLQKFFEDTYHFDNITKWSKQNTRYPVRLSEDDQLINKGYYPAGSIVIWKLCDGLMHIGVIVEDNSDLVFHQIGDGQIIEHCLFDFDIIAVYRINQFRWDLRWGFEAEHGFSKIKYNHINYTKWQQEM